MTARRATGFAPASVGNVAVGFDILGHSLEGVGDRAVVERNDTGVVRIRAIHGVAKNLPLAPEANTAGRALLGLVSKPRFARVGFDVEIHKGIALGSGMGGSAASAVAALVAANSLLDEKLSLAELYELAIDGESVASGSRHGDNVAPMLLGGLVIAPASGLPLKVPVPEGLYCALVHPHFALETKTSRAVLKGSYELHDFVVQSEGLALLLAGCFTHSFETIRRGFRDVLVEPRRASLIPGFAAVKAAALTSGALGASISGGGPSVFAWCEGASVAQAAAHSMREAFGRVGLETDVVVCPVNGPAAHVEASPEDGVTA